MTTRQFKLNGPLIAPGSTGVITMNGTQVFNGAFTGDGTLVETVATGSVNINDALATDGRIIVPVSITVTQGSTHAALFEWDHGPQFNPVYSAEQKAVIESPETTPAQRLAIYEILAVPPLSDAEKAMLLSTDPATRPSRTAILAQHGLSPVIQNPAKFGYGIDIQDSLCNRTNVRLNGLEPAGSDSNVGIAMTAGDVLTADLIVFASNIYPAA